MRVRGLLAITLGLLSEQPPVDLLGVWQYSQSMFVELLLLALLGGLLPLLLCDQILLREAHKALVLEHVRVRAFQRLVDWFSVGELGYKRVLLPLLRHELISLGSGVYVDPVYWHCPAQFAVGVCKHRFLELHGLPLA